MRLDSESEDNGALTWRTSITCVLLALIIVSLAMIWLAVRGYPALWSQRGARRFVLEPIVALVAYAVAVVWIATRRGRSWETIAKIAVPVGILAGCVETASMMVENNLLFTMHGPVVPIGSMATLFFLWGFAGWRAGRGRGSAVAGLIAAVVSAGVCMVLGVTAGFAVELFVVPPSPAAIVYWAEFQRSGWMDARAFGLANTLDSGFTHLLIAPFVAAVLGGLAGVGNAVVGKKRQATS